MSKRSYAIEDKMKVLTVYKRQEYSFSELCSTFNVNPIQFLIEYFFQYKNIMTPPPSNIVNWGAYSMKK